MYDDSPLVLFSHLPSKWSAGSLLVNTLPVTILHRMNEDFDDELDTTLSCTTYAVPRTKHIDFLADIMQQRVEDKAYDLHADFFYPHVEVGEIKQFSGVDFTVIGGAYSTEETGMVIETSYISIDEQPTKVDIIEISTVMPLSQFVTSEPEILDILEHMIIASR